MKFKEVLEYIRLYRLFKEADMDQLLSIFKSRTVWFGLVQSLAGALQIFWETNIVPMVDDPSALLVTGIVTLVLRAVTTEALLDK